MHTFRPLHVFPEQLGRSKQEWSHVIRVLDCWYCWSPVGGRSNPQPKIFDHQWGLNPNPSTTRTLITPPVSEYKHVITARVQFDRWLLSGLFWHLSDIKDVWNFRPQSQMSGGSPDPPDPAFPRPWCFNTQNTPPPSYGLARCGGRNVASGTPAKTELQ